MDMSFANQALATEYLVKHGKALSKDLHKLPRKLDAEIARLKLKTMGIRIDQLTEEQHKYLTSWEMGNSIPNKGVLRGSFFSADSISNYNAAHSSPLSVGLPTRPCPCPRLGLVQCSIGVTKRSRFLPGFGMVRIAGHPYQHGQRARRRQRILGR